MSKHNSRDDSQHDQFHNQFNDKFHSHDGFEVTSKRRKGFPSETSVKRGNRVISTAMDAKELLEKLGRNDLCPCGSGLRFQSLLPQIRPILTAQTGPITSESKLNT